MSRTTVKEAKGLRLSGTIEARVKRLVPKDTQMALFRPLVVGKIGHTPKMA